MKAPLLTFEEALGQLLASARPVPEHESVGLLDATGRVLASDLVSSIAVPPHDNSAMDGYAVRCVDVTQPGVRLPVSQRVPAGASPAPLAAGSAARIFTGAPIPSGADAVVMQERCHADTDGVAIDELPRLGQNIRRRGEDIEVGASVLSAGVRLNAARIGLAASIGVPQLNVLRRLRVAVFFTGDELREPGEALGPGAIFNSNRYMVRSLLAMLGCEVTDLGIVRDDLTATRDALRRAAAAHDVVLTCGGVSVGEEDHVKAAVEAEGALSLWKIAIKPGKPLAFGRVGEADFIGLPGNPVSAFVTFVMLVQPFLCRRMGLRDVGPVRREVPTTFDWLRAESRREFVRVQLDADGRAVLHPRQGSGVLSSCAWADGLLDVAPGRTFAAGELLPYISLREAN
ncbi:gephyrin-like molybdotransferase Glp [Niveibacterium microcysteis]|uniref:molybdopterin molybdotransferase MoeA n=1 Tax=Niveibacterium microcysteis TaxID=2811415 RepID=UPI001FE3F810|nr:gephyrin-like molybdotransferase Glp [Niveibacterium microcysteis]